MAGGAIVGKATMPIFPTMNGFRSAVQKEAQAAGTAGGNTFTKAFASKGKKLGRELKTGFDQAAGDLGAKAIKGFQKDVASAAHANASAMLTQKSAANQVKAAEEALANAIKKHGEDSTQAEAAQIRLEKANLRLSEANTKAETAVNRLRDAQKALADAQGRAASAAEKSSAGIVKSFANLGKVALQPVGVAVSAIGGKLSGLTAPVQKVGAKIGSVFTGARDKTVSVLGDLQTKATSKLTSIGKWAKTSFNELPEGAQKAIGATGGWLSKLGGAAGTAFGALGSGARSAFGALGSHARDAAVSVGQRLKSAADSAYSSLEHVASVSMAGLAAGATLAGTKLVAVGKQAFDLYASYEQAVGGVDTLFKDASSTVQKYAAEAYKTAGVDANTYMSQVTSFSASLISSLGGDTAKAAKLGNTAMIDMSDNANKMGTSIESIQQTYQSLARGSYAMLDNLKLGYGGTKTEMERMIADANKVRAANGQMADLSVDSFGDVVTAIHIMQEELGIAGATSEEAATTIEGSMNAMKAAWSNWLTSLGRDDVDMNQMTETLVSAISAALKNAVPRIKQIAGALVKSIPGMFGSLSELLPEPFQKAFDGIGSALDKFKGVIAPAFAAFAGIGIKGIAPLLSNIPLLGGVLGKLAAPISALGGPITAVVAALGALIATSPELQNSFGSVLQNVGAAFGDAMNIMGPTLHTLGKEFSSMLDAVMPTLTELGKGVAVAFNQVMTTLAPLIPQIILPILQAMRQMMPVIQQVITVIANTAASVLPMLAGILQAIMPVIATIIEQLTPLIPMILTPVMQAITTLVPIIEQLVATVLPIVEQLMPMLQQVIEALIPPITSFIELLLPTILSLVEQLAPVVQGVITAIGDALNTLMPVVQQCVDLIVSFINSVILPTVQSMAPVVTSVINTIINVVKPIAGIIKGVVDVIAGIFSGDWNRVWNGLKGVVSNAIDAVKNIFSGAVDIGRNFIEGLWNGISNMGGWIKDKIGGFCSGVVDNIKGFFGIHSPSRLMRDQIGRQIAKGMGLGIDDGSDGVIGTVGRLGQRIIDLAKTIMPTIGIDAAGTTGGASGQTASATVNGVAGSSTTINVNATGLNAQEAYEVIAMHARRANSGWGGDL